MSELAQLLDTILAATQIPVVYQPIVELDGGQTVAFEALARPAAGVGFADLLELASARGLADRLDWICRASALTSPDLERLPDEIAVFVNAEPASLAAARPDDVEVDDRRWARAVVEITERAAAAHPRALLRGTQLIRAAGAGIALDDVGTDPASLALLAVIGPDVVKLDRAVLELDPASVRVLDAVTAYAERSGAAVLVEGVEDERQLEIARVVGATLVQGHLLGRPGPLPAAVHPPARPLTRRRDSAPIPDHATPFEAIGEGFPHRVATRPTIAAIVRHLEEQVDHHREPLALLATFPDGDQFGGAVQQRYVELADRFAFVAAFGPDLPDLPGPGIETHHVADGDPLLTEWNLVVVGPHYGVALSARATGRGVGADREYEYVVTHDRSRVERCARVLGHRLTRPS